MSAEVKKATAKRAYRQCTKAAKSTSPAKPVDNGAARAPQPFRNVAQQGLFRRRRTDRELESRTTFGILRGLGREHRKLRREMEEDPYLRQMVNERLLRQAEDDGVDVEEDRPFLSWLIKNLPAIIAMIMELISGANGAGGFT